MDGLIGGDRPTPREGVLSGPYLQNGTLQVFDRGTYTIPPGGSVLLRGPNPARMLLAVYPISPMDQFRLYPFEPPGTLGGVVPATFPDPVVWHVAALPGIALGACYAYSFSGGDVRVIEVLTRIVR